VEHAQVGVMHKEVDIDVKQEVNFLDNVEHTQVGVMQANDEVDYLVKDKHTQDVLHKNDVDIPTHVGVDENFIVRDGEQVVHKGYEQCTQRATILMTNEMFNKENEKQINKENFLFKKACNRIFNSLKKRSVEKCDLKFCFKSGDIFKMDDGRVRPRSSCDCGVSLQGDDGRLRPRAKVDFGVVSVDLVLDDGRCRPRDNFYVGDNFCNVGAWMRDDGRLIPRKKCVVCNNFDVMDGRKWCFHDGG